jgi:REP element-mobilizing transposase RayT
MPYIRIWIHLIWSTKNRENIIGKNLKPKLLAHILKNAKEKDIYIDQINCVADHCHLLISLKSEQNISKVAFLLKGESSRWINKNKMTQFHFDWQDEYIAVSVGESQINRVGQYIKHQEQHHRVNTFQEEYNLFINKYGFRHLG